jgi:beta-glucuronidase
MYGCPVSVLTTTSIEQQPICTMLRSNQRGLFLFLSLCLCLSLCPSLPLKAQSTPLLHNAFNRPATSLNGVWKYQVDRYESSVYNFHREPYDSLPPERYDRGALFMDDVQKDKTDRIEYDWDREATLQVPADWNTQDETLFYYEGSVWYRRTFDDPRTALGQRLLLYFGGANYRTDVYVNGRKVGKHLGGFTPFNFFLDDFVRSEDNSLVVRVDNARDPAAVPTDVFDWWNYGGLTRDVRLITLPPTYITDYSIQLVPNQPQLLRGYVSLAGDQSAGQTVTITSPELDLQLELTTNNEGRAEFIQPLPAQNIEYWSPEVPHRYAFTLSSDQDKTTDLIGLRTISTRGSEILLNGEPIFLRGICAHEENPLKGGRATGADDVQLLLNWAKEMNANFIRLAHYPHNEYMARMAEEMGILLWEEIPVYWTIDWENPTTLLNAKQQLRELIARDKNRASVIIWSMANETPQGDARFNFLRDLAKTARKEDPTRLISAALFKERGQDGTLTVADPFADVSDIIAFNEYLGWYEGLPDIIPEKSFSFSQNKPVIVSEWGAGALANFRSDRKTRWTEDYQDWVFEEQLKLMDRIPQLAGITPWLLADFRSPRRMHPTYQNGWNRKGVIGQFGERKLAFKRLQAYYAQRKRN